MVRYQVCDIVVDWLRRSPILSVAADTVPIVGLSGPQGAGKTTIMQALCDTLAEDGLQAVSISIDDFYLTHSEQVALARSHPDNPYLQHRGYPGTHDVYLGAQTLQSLRLLTSYQSTKVPCYDRFAYQGEGDRIQQKNWRVIVGPLHLIILEGWMLGFTPVEERLLGDKHLGVVNTRLAEYRNWHSFLRGFIWIEPEDPGFVRDWRIEAEDRARAEGRTAMSKRRTKAFVEAFLPAYFAYYPGLRKRAPTTLPHLRILIGKNREVRTVSTDWNGGG
ncbi:hypothetical protein [Mesorhizobium sp. CN2-181]|uniref:hypothetical protein n=1 Tax=Mesorhizobium yinganensis TaxID=3157707 RepID=UPI0032B7672E